MEALDIEQLAKRDAAKDAQSAAEDAAKIKKRGYDDVVISDVGDTDSEHMEKSNKDGEKKPKKDDPKENAGDGEETNTGATEGEPPAKRKGNEEKPRDAPKEGEKDPSKDDKGGNGLSNETQKTGSTPQTKPVQDVGLGGVPPSAPAVANITRKSSPGELIPSSEVFIRVVMLYSVTCMVEAAFIVLLLQQVAHANQFATNF
ncbi:unnamed protein product [Toxocara canis]|uniref:Prothymosin alpha-like n=1 Tax=Toxocara canis TaxID=6265 RepID=A0A183UQB5_TOXCA|nr:unnamed protein product [Toxocara canis]